MNETLRRVTLGRTVLSVTHRLRSAMDADIIVVMQEGRIAEMGRHADLLAKAGLYAAQWRKQGGFTVAADGSGARVESGKLSDISFLRYLDAAQLERVGQLLVSERHAAGATVMAEGELGSGVHIVARGQLEVIKNTPAGPLRVDTMSDGDHFGEISLLRNAPRNATVKTLTDCVLLSLSGDLFRRLVERNEALKESIEKVVGERQRNTGIGKMKN